MKELLKLKKEKEEQRRENLFLKKRRLSICPNACYNCRKHRRGYDYSPAAIHKYMNTQLGLHSIVRPKKPGYEHGKPRKVFENKLNQDFTADKANQKWCTDFT